MTQAEKDKIIKDLQDKLAEAEKIKVDKPKQLKRWKPKGDEEYWGVDYNGFIFKNSCGNDGVDNWCYLTGNCFKTKEDAEWELEFGDVTYTKKLKLPTWKQMQENIDWGIDCANRNWYLLKSRGNSIIRIEDWNWNGIYEEPLTYENYLEACRICKKLFLGEEL